MPFRLEIWDEHDTRIEKLIALVGQVQHLPRELRRSLTWDRGKELADHQRLTLATDLDVYFCDPSCAGEANEGGFDDITALCGGSSRRD
jgi:IS30 family transposase